MFGAWDTDNTNADPDVCVNNGNGITDFHRTLTEEPMVVSEPTSVVTEDEPIVDAVVPGAIHEAGVTYGTTQLGAITSTGTSTLYATLNGVSKALIASIPAGTGTVIAI